MLHSLIKVRCNEDNWLLNNLYSLPFHYLCLSVMPSHRFIIRKVQPPAIRLRTAAAVIQCKLIELVMGFHANRLPASASTSTAPRFCPLPVTVIKLSELPARHPRIPSSPSYPASPRLDLRRLRRESRLKDPAPPSVLVTARPALRLRHHSARPAARSATRSIVACSVARTATSSVVRER